MYTCICTYHTHVHVQHMQQIVHVNTPAATKNIFSHHAIARMYATL
jgi:hypothetical protein